MTATPSFYYDFMLVKVKKVCEKSKRISEKEAKGAALVEDDDYIR